MLDGTGQDHPVHRILDHAEVVSIGFSIARDVVTEFGKRPVVFLVLARMERLLHRITVDLGRESPIFEKGRVMFEGADEKPLSFRQKDRQPIDQTGF